MKVYSLGELVGEFLWLVFGYVCYGFGGLVVPFLTMGFARAAAARDQELTFSWCGLARGRDGKTVLSTTLTAFVGLTVLLILVAALVWVLNAPGRPLSPDALAGGAHSILPHD